MTERIIRLLEKLGAEHYMIEDCRTESEELFFITKRLDMCRGKKTEDITVTVYRDAEKDGERMRGSSKALLTPDMDDEEITTALKEAENSALNALNPWYELYHGTKESPVLSQAKAAGMELTQAAFEFAEALYAPDHDERAWINSSEIFAEKTERHLISSEGTDVSWTDFRIEGEFVTQCRQPVDVEQHYSFEYDDLEAESIREKAAEGLKTVRDRAEASAAPKAGTYDIVLSGKHLAEILDYYRFRANGAYIYAGYSDWAVGKAVQEGKIAGEKLNMTLCPREPYSPEGIPVKRKKFIREGKLEFIESNARFAFYLHTEPTGEFGKIELHNGTVPFDELKKGCLYPVSFSDFQMDPMSGYFAGEIRLAYYYGDNGVEILTGGSVNASLIEKQSDLVFSTETYKDADYEGPLAVRIRSVSVAG